MDGGMQQEMIQQQQMQLMMLDETMNGPQAVRYDEVYYPRTDKRSISKSLEHILFARTWLLKLNVTPLFFLFCAIEGNQYTYKGNEYNSKTQSASAV